MLPPRVEVTAASRPVSTRPRPLRNATSSGPESTSGSARRLSARRRCTRKRTTACHVCSRDRSRPNSEAIPYLRGSTMPALSSWVWPLALADICLRPKILTLSSPPRFPPWPGEETSRSHTRPTPAHRRPICKHSRTGVLLSQHSSLASIRHFRHQACSLSHPRIWSLLLYTGAHQPPWTLPTHQGRPSASLATTRHYCRTHFPMFRQ